MLCWQGCKVIARINQSTVGYTDVVMLCFYTVVVFIALVGNIKTCITCVWPVSLDRGLCGFTVITTRSLAQDPRNITDLSSRDSVNVLWRTLNVYRKFQPILVTHTHAHRILTVLYCNTAIISTVHALFLYNSFIILKVFTCVRLRYYGFWVGFSLLRVKGGSLPDWAYNSIASKILL